MSARPSVSLCIIARDAEPYWRKCLESIVRPCIQRYGGPAFDEIVVLIDNRTTDDTEAIAREFAAQQEALGGRFVISHHDWPDDFSVARQRSFELATGDWRGWVDSDDVMVGAEYVKPTICEAIPAEDVMLDLVYHYIVAPDGRVKQRQIRERFVKWAYGFKWLHPVHEALVPSKSIHNPRRAYPLDEKMLIIHQRTESEIMEHGERNDALMNPDLATNPATRHRLLFHRAAFLKGRGEREEAEECLREVVETEALYTDMDSFYGSIWALGELLAEDKRFDEAKVMALKHMEKVPASRRGRFLMGFIYAHQGNYTETIRWIFEAFSIPKQEEYIQRNEEQFAVMAAAATLAFPCPLEVREQALTICKRECVDKTRLAVPRDLEQVVRTTRMETSCRDYLRYMEDHEEFDKARAAGLLLPYPLKRNFPIALQRRRTANYLRKHATADFNGTWKGIPQAYVDNILADNRAGEGMLHRALWAAERLWANGWKRVLEIGCCDGLVLGYLAARFPDREFVGIDPDPFVIEHAQKMWKLPNLKFIHAALGDDLRLAVMNHGNWCDGWILFEVVEHVKSSRDLVLPCGKPGLVTTPTTQPDRGAPPEITPGPAGHRRILSLAEILSDFQPTSAQARPGGMCDQTMFEVPDGMAVLGPFTRWQDVDRPVKQRPWILLLCHGSPVPWGPESPYTRGLTGSEECAVYLAEALAKTGARVVVMADRLEGRERIVNGVMWTHPDYLAEHDLYDPDGEHTTLVVWRQPGLTDFVKSLPVKKRVLWLHDAASVYKDIPALMWNDFDTVVAATEYHKRTFEEAYPALAGKIVVIRHGIHEMPKAMKIPGKVVYASSPDRGLERLLKWWPDVVAANPKAQLHIFYGRNNMRAFAAAGALGMTEFADKIEALIASTPNVFDHGLVPHPELHRHLAEAVALAYPTSFEEISCLTVQKAQVAATPIIWSPGGCLREVINGATEGFVGPFWDDPATLDSDEAGSAFIEKMVDLLHAKLSEKFYAAARSVARDAFSTWPAAAAEWRSIL